MYKGLNKKNLCGRYNIEAININLPKSQNGISVFVVLFISCLHGT